MNKTLLHIILYTAISMMAWQGNAQELRDYISLNGKWYFSIGDDSNWAQDHYNHDSWEQIRVPSLWEHQGFNGYDGFAWYRREVDIPIKAQKLSLWLDLGFIDDADEVFLNGELINKSGQFPPAFKTAYNAHRLYKLPNQLIRYGRANVIAVRVYDAYNEGGIISGNIGIKAEIHPLIPDISLEGKWRFKTGDESYYKAIEYNDRNWEQISVPRSWEEQGYDGYNGMAWYRKTITIPEHLQEEALVLLLGKIDDVDETYINGILIGQTGEISDHFFFPYNEAWKALRGYIIPRRLYQSTRTLSIAIRVQDRTQTGGIYEGPVGIITMDKYIDYWNEKRNK
ncbi:glycoside hydrolase [Carboxylicivirga taeanensis]|uniref:glycoside hydrolase n=1 Tax=Carboxylicivirga taeanensis TaxID=1416875 RepID=UPI003F6E2ADD